MKAIKAAAVQAASVPPPVPGSRVAGCPGSFSVGGSVVGRSASISNAKPVSIWISMHQSQRLRR